MQKNTVLVVGFLLLVLFFLFQYITWGAWVIRPPQTITVTGTAHSQEANQVASFYAGANAVNSDKQKAVDEVNAKVQDVLTKLEQFGIAKEDIQTQNLSVYQDQEQYTEGGVVRSRPGMWRATNSLNIKLQDIAKASDLVALLTASGLTDISGPNYSLDDTTEAQTALLTKAVDDARDKADMIAKEQGKQVYKVLSIVEGTGSAGGPFPMFDRAMGGGGGVPTEPGSTTVSSTVTVTFEMR